MAVLNKLRTKFGLAVSIIVALGLLSFIIDPGQIQSAVQSMSSKYDVGEINGKSISYTDFQEDIDKYTTLNELLTGSSVSSESQQNEVRDAAWQALVDKYLFLKNAKAAGIKVGEDEMFSLLTGENPSPVVTQNGVFVDENGNYSPAAVVDFVSQVNSDPTGRLQLYWNYVQTTANVQQYYTKYGSIFNAGAYQNKLMLKRAVAENNQTTDLEFVMLPLTYATDSTITVSDSEIKEYYNSHKDFFKQSASRDAEYVVFEVRPSASDIAAANEALTDVYDEFATTENMKSFLLKNSERSLSNYWYKNGELNSIHVDINEFAFSDQKGASPVISTGNTFYAARVMDSKMIPDSAYVKHMMFVGDNAKQLADSLVNVANASNFSTLAALYSDDKNSADNGQLGNIGWLSQQYMIPGFEAVIEAAVNKPFVLNTQYGTHVVLVSEKSKPVLKKQVAILEKTAVPSNETYNSMYSQANKFASIAAGSYSNYLAAVDTMGVYSQSISVSESTSTIGGVDNAKEVTRWIFDNKKGKVSEIITINQNYFFITTVKAIHEEGYATVNEAAMNIRGELYAQKALEKMAAEVATKISGLNSMEEIAEALNTTVSVQNGVTFAALGASSLDPKFIGAASVAPEGKISAPVAGSTGVYVFKVTGRDTGSYYTEDDATLYEAQKNQYNSQMILPVMMDAAGVKDNRARFF